MTQGFSFIHVRSAFVPPDADFFGTISAFDTLLERCQGQLRENIPATENIPLLYFMDTGGTEKSLLEFHAQRKMSHPDEPVWLIAHSGYNSLPASLEVLARLQQEQIEGRIFFLKDREDIAGINQITDALEDLRVCNQLKNSKIGLIGDPSDWLVASSPDSEMLQRQWGPTVIKIPIQELTDGMAQIFDPELASITADLTGSAVEVLEPSKAEVNDVARVYLALKKLIQTYGLQAVSLRCFDLVLNQRTTGCFALSQLMDEGVVSGCEGDLVSTVGMLWAQALTGQAPWMANPAHLDDASNSMTLAHCTVPRNLVTSYGLRSHFESGLGVGIQGVIPSGPVTLLRIGGKEMQKLWLAQGTITDSGQNESLCRTQVDISLTSGHVGDLLSAPLGNHLVMLKGHHASDLQRSWKTIMHRSLGAS